MVSGTTATHGSKAIGVGDPSAQTHFIIDKIQGSIESLGGRLEDVVRTRIFVADLEHWEAVSRAHGARFAEIKPANTMVEARLIGDEYLVEIEAEAIISTSA
jgi:enamine deaminase RidA (YjgF/YER057c/UK114 family)